MKKNIKTNFNLKNEESKKIREFSQMRVEENLKLLNTSFEGLKKENIESMRELFGKNIITHGKKKSLTSKIVEAFINPFTAVLFCLAIVSFFTDMFIPWYYNDMDEFSPITVIIITTMVTISGILRFIQEEKSNNAAESLASMITTTTSVKRFEQTREELPLEEVVVGDIVYLAAGDIIPADIRIIECKDFFISQASLTGESEPIEKTIISTKNDNLAITELNNIVFMGSNVVSGSGIGVVIATGDSTLFGSISKSITTSVAVESAFEKGINSVSWLLIRFMLVMVPIVFFINGFTKGNWIQALLFAISIAVGLTPEMLPMIVTTCLAKGAVSMAKKKTIVKNLNSIQNFGSMDILCTDKTGTITLDKVVLEYHMDIHGKEDNRILHYAFLNSWFQTGLKNLLDLSIIEKTEEEGEKDDSLKNLNKIYTKIDEIPFDFSRRRMTVVVKDQLDKRLMITKGAVEEMLSICKYSEYNNEIVLLTDKIKKEILERIDSFNEDGLRVIALAYKENPSSIETFGVSDEKDMILMGYLAFLDPPKPTTAKAIATLKEYGVRTKVLTGDNDKVTKSICKKVGLNNSTILLGSDIDRLNDIELAQLVETTDIFAKLSPLQKTRIVEILKKNNHTVGFLGDGINDASAMKTADIGISVDTAVDIAKESADIILLEKDLMVLEEGIIEGRKTYANMIKYIKMTASSNFGNMFSVLIASAFLPFLPMMSIHLILLNLIYDLSCTAIPWDNVDTEFLKIPRKWESSSIGKFMIWIGPVSSIFDITTYILMYFIICPLVVSNGTLYNSIPLNNEILRESYEAVFQTGWFIESMWTQTLVIHMIRTPKISFVQSIASLPVMILTVIGILCVSIIPYTKLGNYLGLTPLPFIFWIGLILTAILYMFVITFVKRKYTAKYGELL
ncbi:magnesium-translocating P-type ATPase [Fusobacterium sp.]|uniref:magnesium-translocating P-type ATPase n=1 Tax=Fusobacterium sp. TaxID=68766 RepID=UPI002612CD64|nr:magnesium-translocating P-type ATPase [Fusobacterium sp.]